MNSKQYVWRVPGGTMQITAVGDDGDECYFIDNDRPLREDATLLVAAPSQEIADTIREAIDFWLVISILDNHDGNLSDKARGEREERCNVVLAWLRRIAEQKGETDGNATN